MFIEKLFRPHARTAFDRFCPLFCIFTELAAESTGRSAATAIGLVARRRAHAACIGSDIRLGRRAQVIADFQIEFFEHGKLLVEQ